MEQLKSLIEHRLRQVNKSGNDTIYLCPKCDDKSGHLYVDYDKGFFHCFHCGFKGRSLEYLARSLGIPVSDELLELSEDSQFKDDLEDVIAELSPSNHTRSFLEPANRRDISSYYYQQSKELSPEARSYLHQRDLTDAWIDFYRIREGIDLSERELLLDGELVQGMNLSGRVLIPSRDLQGDISYFLARDYLGCSDRKYLNPRKVVARAQEDLWNAELIQGDFVIICEGVFTAMAVNNLFGYPVATATYGKSISKPQRDTPPGTSQLERLVKMDKESYILFYDKDAKEETYKMSKLLSSYNLEVSYVTIPDEVGDKHTDAADLDHKTLLEVLRFPNRKKFNPLNFIIL